MAAGEGTTTATKRKTACVTGGSGYIASALVKMLLEKGYAVKSTVRNPDDAEKNAHLKALAASGPLEVFRADLNEEGSFDDAVAGCDYAFLLAAPVNLYAEDPEKDVIEPAVYGTLNVMRSCIKAGTVKRVVLTSSAAAVTSRPLEGDGHVLDEGSWSDVEFLRSTKTGPWAYPVSKVLLEKAACAFAEENGLSLVTVCPVVTVGEAPAAEARTSVGLPLALLSGDDTMAGTLEHIERATGSIPMVHVDDLCRAEVFVAEEEVASGGTSSAASAPPSWSSPASWRPSTRSTTSIQIGSEISPRSRECAFHRRSLSRKGLSTSTRTWTRYTTTSSNTDGPWESFRTDTMSLSIFGSQDRISRLQNKPSLL